MQLQAVLTYLQETQCVIDISVASQSHHSWEEDHRRHLLQMLNNTYGNPHCLIASARDWPSVLPI